MDIDFLFVPLPPNSNNKKNYGLDVKRLNKTKKILAFLCELRYTIIVPRERETR